MSHVTHCILLRRCYLLNSKGVVEETVAGEVLAHIFLDELDTQIGIVHALDLVADTRNKLVLLPALVDKLAGGQTGIARLGEHGRRLVERTSEPRADREQTRCERRDQVLARTRGDDRVHGTRGRDFSTGHLLLDSQSTHPDTAGP